ncbi:MAG: class I SAM-dependent methyltransferase [Acidimicrobiia bacterium]
MNTQSWDHLARLGAGGLQRPTDAASYGPGGPTERTVRLLGDLRGKRVLELGCGSTPSAIAFSRQGATAIAIDASEAQLANARRLAESEEVKVEFHCCDVADLAFLRADSIDLVFSAYALDEVEDVNRVFRQVHRVLRHHAGFVFSTQHPVAAMLGRDGPSSKGRSGTATLPLGNFVVTRSYFDAEPVTVDVDGQPVVTYPRPVSDVFMALGRAGFDVDAIVEAPFTEGDAPGVPATIIWRARKEGV